MPLGRRCQDSFLRHCSYLIFESRPVNIPLMSSERKRESVRYRVYVYVRACKREGKRGRLSHICDSRVSSLFSIDLRICSPFDRGLFISFDGLASRLIAHSRAIEWIVSRELDSTLVLAGRYIATYLKSLSITEYVTSEISNGPWIRVWIIHGIST